MDLQERVFQDTGTAVTANVTALKRIEDAHHSTDLTGMETNHIDLYNAFNRQNLWSNHRGIIDLALKDYGLDTLGCGAQDASIIHNAKNEAYKVLKGFTPKDSVDHFVLYELAQSNVQRYLADHPTSLMRMKQQYQNSSEFHSRDSLMTVIEEKNNTIGELKTRLDHDSMGFVALMGLIIYLGTSRSKKYLRGN